MIDDDAYMVIHQAGLGLFGRFEPKTVENFHKEQDWDALSLRPSDFLSSQKQDWDALSWRLPGKLPPESKTGML